MPSSTFNQAPQPAHLYGHTVRSFIDLQAAMRPSQVYLFAPETGLKFTYRQLQADCRSLCNFLSQSGMKKGDKVSFMLHNGYQTARIFLGAMYGGYVVCPINLLAQPSQLEYVVDHSDTKLVFVAVEYLEPLKSALKNISRPVRLVTVDIDAPTVSEEDVFPELPLPGINPEDDALLMYTSGTTGKPKGVILSHKNVISGGEYTSAAHQLTPADRVLCALPLYHINGQVVTTIAPLVHGGSVVMPHRFSVSRYWDMVEQYHCTWLNMVPTLMSYLLNASGPEVHLRNPDVRHVRFCRSASAPLPPSLHRGFEEKFGIGVIETMGLTETAAPVFSNPLDPAKRKYGSPGMAFGNEAKVIDANGNTLAPYQQGEIMVRGDNVMHGYYKAPELTVGALQPDGWLHTGDIGYVDTDGFYFITGRLKELIIKGGENISPREIDEALLKHPAVLEAAAVGIPDEHYGQDILACVVLKPGQHCSAEELHEFSLKALGKYKTPKAIKFMATLPKGPSGKVQRLKLLDCV